MALGRYNLAPYNRTAVLEISENQASYRMYATVTALVAIDVELSISYRCHETLEGEANLQFFHNESYELAQEIVAGIRPTVDHKWGGEMTAELTGEANAPVPVGYRMEQGMTAEAGLRLEVILVANLFALLSATIDSLISTEEEMRFESLVLKPNQSLVIDSDTFTVLVDGEDAIDLYRGEWPFFDKKLEGVTVETLSGGNAAVSILYRERYL